VRPALKSTSSSIWQASKTVTEPINKNIKQEGGSASEVAPDVVLNLHSEDEVQQVLRLSSSAVDVGSLDPELREDDAPKGFDQYEERYVLFIDILGFTELINKSIKDEPPLHGSVAAIFQALDWNFDGVADDLMTTLGLKSGPVDLRVHTFSDFVIASCPASEVGLATILFAAFHISRQWLSTKYLSRGGITKGPVLHRTGQSVAPMVFGPAFVEAYKLESQVADLPRIILSQKVRKECADLSSRQDELGSFIRKVVHRCDDGPSCIDVFTHLRINGIKLAQDHMREAGQFQDALEHHLEEAADTPTWYRKTSWLSQRFNTAVKDTMYAHMKLNLDI
jgi:hypothetical protein